MADKQISTDEKTDEKTMYYKRLTEPYGEKKDKVFIDQYLQGSGNELKEKFWSPNSSSRLAFDLYSWIALDPLAMDFQFEKKLPGVICSKRGPAGAPNMDVFIETEHDIIFIESKYTEKAKCFKNGCLKYINNGDDPELSKAYWDKKEYGGLDLTKRFYNEENIAKCFSEFCDTINKSLGDKKYEWKWFDAKQETCHLFGIIFYLLGAAKYGGKYECNPKKINKKVHLCNIICEKEKMNIENLSHKSFPYSFAKKAEDLVKECVKDINFTFEIMTVQNLLNSHDFFGFDFTKAKAFGLECSLKCQMKQYNRKGYSIV